MGAIKTRGAIIAKAPGRCEVAELDLDEPRQGEITVRLAASGLCRTDDQLATGDMAYGIYPVCGGHEGAGTVVQVGPGITGWHEGEGVVFSFLPACGKCRWCGRQLICGYRWSGRTACCREGATGGH